MYRCWISVSWFVLLTTVTFASDALAQSQSGSLLDTEQAIQSFAKQLSSDATRRSRQRDVSRLLSSGPEDKGGGSVSPEILIVSSGAGSEAKARLGIDLGTILLDLTLKSPFSGVGAVSVLTADGVGAGASVTGRAQLVLKTTTRAQATNDYSLSAANSEARRLTVNSLDPVELSTTVEALSFGESRVKTAWLLAASYESSRPKHTYFDLVDGQRKFLVSNGRVATGSLSWAKVTEGEEADTFLVFAGYEDVRGKKAGTKKNYCLSQGQGVDVCETLETGTPIEFAQQAVNLGARYWWTADRAISLELAVVPKDDAYSIKVPIQLLAPATPALNLSGGVEVRYDKTKNGDDLKAAFFIGTRFERPKPWVSPELRRLGQAAASANIRQQSQELKNRLDAVDETKKKEKPQ